jgi:hypothetical protein
MGAGESEVNEIQAQINDTIEDQIKEAVGEIVPKAEKSQQTEFVMPGEIIGDLGKLCKRLEKVKEEKKEEKKEEYQINNSYEISGFNLKMK